MQLHDVDQQVKQRRAICCTTLGIAIVSKGRLDLQNRRIGFLSFQAFPGFVRTEEAHCHVQFHDIFWPLSWKPRKPWFYWVAACDKKRWVQKTDCKKQHCLRLLLPSGTWEPKHFMLRWRAGITCTPSITVGMPRWSEDNCDESWLQRPLHYFIDERGKQILFPTVLATCGRLGSYRKSTREIESRQELFICHLNFAYQGFKSEQNLDVLRRNCFGTSETIDKISGCS